MHLAVPRLPSWILLPLAAACASEAERGAVHPTPPRDEAPMSAPADASANDAFDDSDCNLSTVLDPNKPGSPGHLIPSQRNPNGDSELAALMRHFVDDLQETRVLLEARHEVPKLWPVHRTMRCAWTTSPSDRNEQFDLRAQAYLYAVRAFDAQPGKETYNGLIAGCIACHSQSCGGPIPFIDGMKWQ